MKAPREIEFEVVGRDTPSTTDPFIALIARWMDTQFIIPGTNFRFGLDPLIGLVPGPGDTAAAILIEGGYLPSFVTVTLWR